MRFALPITIVETHLRSVRLDLTKSGYFNHLKGGFGY